MGRQGDAAEGTPGSRRLGHLARPRGQEGSGSAVSERRDLPGSTTSPAVHARSNAATSARASKPANGHPVAARDERPGTLGDRRGQPPEAIGTFAAHPPDGVEDALDVVGRFAGLEDRDGDVHERVERVDGLDRAVGIDR